MAYLGRDNLDERDVVVKQLIVKVVCIYLEYVCSMLCRDYVRPGDVDRAVTGGWRFVYKYAILTAYGDKFGPDAQVLIMHIEAEMGTQRCDTR